MAPYQRPADIETRQEALGLSLVTKSGDPVQFIAMIHREGGTVSLGKTQVIRGGALFTFAPFYSAWGRAIPKEWVKMSISVIAPDPASD